jgi:hypothetical protein
MQNWSAELSAGLKIVPPESDHLASIIEGEVMALSSEAKQRVRAASLIPLEARIEELRAFQSWMDLASEAKTNPVMVRAQVVTQIYICFVYLGEACFKVLRKELSGSSTTKKCCKFLTENPVRALRNAVAHSNWQYLPDFSGLEFWAKEGTDPAEGPSRFVVLQRELDFWQALARCTAYASYLGLHPSNSSKPGSKNLLIQ